jgi:hypothetical protein
MNNDKSWKGIEETKEEKKFKQRKIVEDGKNSIMNVMTFRGKIERKMSSNLSCFFFFSFSVFLVVFSSVAIDSKIPFL